MNTQENQSDNQNAFGHYPADAGQGSTYGIPDFDSLPREEKNLVMETYAGALENGATIPEAELAAVTALHKIRTQDETDEDQSETPNAMPTVAKLAFLLAAACAVAYFFLQAFLGPTNPDPLKETSQVRAQAALELRAANDALKDATRVHAQAKARYEASYKREACLIYKTCK